MRNLYSFAGSVIANFVSWTMITYLPANPIIIFALAIIFGVLMIYGIVYFTVVEKIIPQGNHNIKDTWRREGLSHPTVDGFRIIVLDGCRFWELKENLKSCGEIILLGKFL